MKDFCKPCILAGFSLSSRPVSFDIKKVQSAAFEAVMATYIDYMAQYRYSASHKSYIDNMLAAGDESLKIKTRFRPIVTGRYLMYNCLKSIGYSAPKIAKIYNSDRTSVLHGCEKINSMLKGKFDNDIKDAYILFNRLIG